MTITHEIQRVGVTIERRVVRVTRSADVTQIFIAGEGGGGTYTHTQAVAATTWTITHNLNARPSVTVIDSGGNLVLTNIVYNSVNQLTISFSSATAGVAYLN